MLSGCELSQSYTAIKKNVSEISLFFSCFQYKTFKLLQTNVNLQIKIITRFKVPSQNIWMITSALISNSVDRLVHQLPFQLFIATLFCYLLNFKQSSSGNELNNIYHHISGLINILQTSLMLFSVICSLTMCCTPGWYTRWSLIQMHGLFWCVANTHST